MKFVKAAMISALMICFQLSYSQNDTDTSGINSDTSQIKVITMDEAIISANKFRESKRTVAQQVQALSAKEIESMQAQSTADLIANTGNVFVQKSQHGGGSPVIRGFEANRVLLMVDGVRMNNLMYRAGHLQDIIKTDNNSLDRVEILFGPSSTIYGSDALGGVIHLYTKKPLFATGNDLNIRTNAFYRYGTVNKESTGHVDFNAGGKKFASLTSFTYSKFDDLRGGENQNPFYTASYGERPFYADRINGTDTLIINADRYLQVKSGYSQYDVLQKFAFRQTEYITHDLNFQYSNSTDVPRYDRLTDAKGSGLQSAEWYYGPQERMLAAYNMNLNNQGSTFQAVRIGLNYQHINESRHNRNFGSSFRNNRIENADVIGTNLDFRKIINAHDIRFGADAQLNYLASTANRQNIVDGSSEKSDTRYPDGKNNMNHFAAYFSHTWQINNEITITDGIRGGYSSLRSTLVDTATQFHLPYTLIEQKTPVFSGSIGIINSPSEDLKLSLLVSTGFRVPNVDDAAKIFASQPGAVIVPNINLKPERTINYEAGITNIFNEKAQWENVIYYTDLYDAIVTDKFIFNGRDSIIYDGTLSRVYANQNKGRAYVYGFSSNLKSQCNKYIFLSLMLNYTYGRIKTDSADYPLDHIPPLLSRFMLTYTNGNFSSDVFVNFNGWKRLKNYNPGGEDNQQYATPDGMPAWFTLNLHASYKLHKLFTIQAGIENILDTQYRTFASGINAPGRNIFAALRFHY